MSDLIQLPISELPIRTKIAVPGSPDWVAIDHSAVWISNKARDSISRIDPRANTVAATVAVGPEPCSGLVAAFGSVWVPSCAQKTVDRVDGVSNRVVATIPVGIADSEGGIAADATAVWMMADSDGTLARIDPASNRVSARMRIDSASFVVTAGAGAVWISSTGYDVVSRFDPNLNEVTARIPVGPSPRFMCALDDDIWVLNQGDGSVSRIDSRTNQVVSTIAVGVPGSGGDIAAGEGSVWVTAIDVPLTRIDPRTNTVKVQYVGRGGDAIRVGFGSVWLCSFFLEEVWRVDAELIGV